MIAPCGLRLRCAERFPAVQFGVDVKNPFRIATDKVEWTLSCGDEAVLDEWLNTRGCPKALFELLPGGGSGCSLKCYATDANGQPVQKKLLKGRGGRKQGGKRPQPPRGVPPTVREGVPPALAARRQLVSLV